MKILVCLILILHQFSEVSSADADPCLIAVMIGDPKRSITNIPTEVDPLICDNDMNEKSWYRFDAYTGGKLPEHCVGINHCGTFGTVWLNGTHPTVKDTEPVERFVCGTFRQGKCCGWRKNIKVKRCAGEDGEYFVYQLVRTPKCDFAYCAGAGDLCGMGLAYNSIKKMCTEYSVITSDPVLGVPYISTWEEVSTPRRTRINSTSLAIDCHIEYLQKVKDDGVRFDVVFQTDGGVELAKFKTDSSNLTVTLDGSYLEGHLGKTLTCKVRSYLESNDPGLYKSRFYFSQKYWFGIQPDETCGYTKTSNSGKSGSSFTITTTSRVGLKRTIQFIRTDSKERLNYIKNELVRSEKRRNKAVEDRNNKMMEMGRLKEKLKGGQARITTFTITTPKSTITTRRDYKRELVVKEKLDYIKKGFARNEQKRNEAVKDKNETMMQMEKLKKKLEVDQARIAKLEEKIKKLNTCKN